MSIEVKNLSYRYENAGENHSGRMVLKGVNLTLDREHFIAIIGPTGSGKSTFIQHLPLLLRAVDGDILYDGKSIYDKDFDKKQLRQEVGIVFQYPEYQLFETDILQDVCFGPKNLGLPQEEIEKRAKETLKLVGIKEEDFEKSPFELSGGQKRRVAIAGVLAMSPKYLILDEPAAGLDPKGRDELFGLLRMLADNSNVGIILVSHSMEDVAKYADRVIVFDDGNVLYDGTPCEVFKHADELGKIGLDVPLSIKVSNALIKKGFKLSDEITTLEDAANQIVKSMK